MPKKTDNFITSYPRFILICTCFILLTIWFHKGLIYGGGDIGLPLYDPKVSAELTKYTWWDTQGTGFSYPGVFSSHPFYLLFSLFQKIGFSSLALQILYFGSILITSSLGMYTFIKWVTKDKYISFWGSFYYLINPYSVMLVWHRFAHTTMMLMAFLPWTLFLFFKGLSEKDTKYIFYLVFISIIGSYAFGTPSLLATWWFVICTSFIWQFFHYKSRKDKLFSILYFASFVLIWIGVHFWWIHPFLETAGETLSLTSTSSGNIESLRGVSKFFQIPYAFRGISTFYITDQIDWGLVYQSSLFSMISWTGFFFILISFFKKKKSSIHFYFILVFLFSVFFSKGVGSPFGNLIVYSFNLLPALAVFRNPFEKFGLIIPLAGAFLFGVGVDYLLKVIERLKHFHFIKYITFVVLALFFIGYQFPMWSPYLFGNIKSPAYIKVPEDYEMTSQWLKNNTDNKSRILHLPLALSDGISYDWEYGYHGLEPSQLFFNRSSISHYIGYDIVDDRYKEIALAVRNNDKNTFKSLLSQFGITHVMYHGDVDTNLYTYDNDDNIKTFLSDTDILTPQFSYGNLSVYSINSDTSKIVIVTEPTIIRGGLSFLRTQLLERNINTPFIYTSKDDSTKGATYIFPNQTLSYPPTNINRDNAVNELPYVRIFPDNPLYPLVRLKEKVSYLEKTEDEQFFLQLELASKRLVEINGLVTKDSRNDISMYLKEYVTRISSIETELLKRTAYLSNFYKSKEFENLQIIFLRQKAALQDHIIPKVTDDNLQSAMFALQSLESIITKAGLRQSSQILDPVVGMTFRFEVPDNSAYKMVFISESWKKELIDNKKASIYVDGEVKSPSYSEENNVILTSPIQFKSGYHEITIPTSIESILTNISKKVKDDSLYKETNNEQDITSVYEDNYIEYIVNDVDKNSFYIISFDYLLRRGMPPKLEVIQDIDLVVNGKVRPALDHQTVIDGYTFDWINDTQIFKPSPFAKKLTIRIRLSPWNNCKSIHYKEREKCNDESYAKPYNKESNAIIRNLSVTKRPTAGVALYKEPVLSSSVSTVEFNKIDPVTYNLSHIPFSQNSWLIFKETYHSGWQLKNEGGNTIHWEHRLANGFGNGWKIEENDRPVTISHVPQDKMKNGFIIMVIVFLIGIIITKITNKYA